ncbi:uncharacterized protein [Henckelia pumila]|uniref:uncharacterized protein n=1 Tax=Henckelia pumila TaxID=405737 RepID=UPI003C6E2F44
MAVNQPQLVDFSKTQRLVFLIDLQPLLTFQNPSAYIAAVNSAASRLLRFPPLSASLFAYKFFFSSLPPLRSADVLPRHLCSPSISFSFPLETLASLSTNLNSVLALLDLPNPPGRPIVVHFQSALLQLIHDYGWENEHEISVGRDKSMLSEILKIPSNLVLLFSPLKFLLNSISLHDSEELLVKFGGIFCPVREAFLSRDLHVCWIDVNSDELQLKNINDKNLDHKYETESHILVNCIRKMGWGFSSTNCIVLGSALLPLGLIYPKIGLQFDFVGFGGMDKSKCCGQLNLEILDMKGMPLDYKSCDLEFVKLKSLPSAIKNNFAFGNLEYKNLQCEDHDEDSFLSQFGDGSIKLYVKGVLEYCELEKIGRYSEHVFVSEFLEEMGKSRKKCSGDFFADRVLESLHKDMGRVTYRSHIPTWQFFLTFLHINSYSAVVSFSCRNGSTCIGSIKPLTAHLAILSILDCGNVLSNCISQSKLLKIDDRVHDACAEDLPDSNPCFGSQTESSTSGNYEKHAVGKRKKKRIQLYQQMTWNSFCKAALEGSQMDLFEVYTAGQFENSKKLKFMKCWMKQIGKIDPYFLRTSHRSKSTEELSASCVPSAMEEAMLTSSSETSESFFNNLPKRIQQGLESGIDLQILAQRVVKSSIHWLHKKRETENNSIDQAQRQILDGSCSDAFDVKLMELLLREPKEMKEMHQEQDSPSKASQLPSSSENIVRDYELQIFLRMEIMRSDDSAMIEESRKQKLLKQICSLLEIIQYLVAGGIHGHISLYDYVERIIKERYSEELEDIVRKIYTKMDFLPFGDEDETPSLLFNSEDSNQSWKDKHEKAEAHSISQSVSAEDEYSNCEENKKEKGVNNHFQMLNKAREQRERARRFVSFTSRVQDLQRVWAPKQQQQKMKDKLDSLPKKSKRKDWHDPGYSVVHETPLTGNKLTHAKRDNGQENFGNSCSVSKALFQDICPDDKSTA